MRLILMRHAKSDWAGPTEPDQARPLNKRGRRSATAMGDWLRAQDMLPELVLCSTATRTRQTLDRLALSNPVTRFDDRLYHAEAAVIWDVLSEADGPSVLLIGHNPGLAVFAAEAVAERPTHARFTDYPTCATTVIDFPTTTWPDMAKGTGIPRAFAIPREVMET